MTAAVRRRGGCVTPTRSDLLAGMTALLVLPVAVRAGRPYVTDDPQPVEYRPRRELQREVPG